MDGVMKAHSYMSNRISISKGMNHSMYKRLLVYSLLMALCANWMPVGIIHANAAAQFSLSSTSKKPGLKDQFQVQVKASGLTDLYGYELNVTYDQAKLKMVSASTISGSGFSVAPIVEESMIKLAHTQVGAKTGLSGSATIGVITFRATHAGEAKIELTSLKLVNSQMETTTAAPGSKLTVQIQQASSDDNGKSSTVFIQGMPDASGKMKAAVDKAQLEQAIASADGKSVLIEIVIGDKPANGVEISLPVSSLYSNGKAVLEQLMLRMGDVDVAFDLSKMLDLIPPGSQQLTLSIVKVDTAGLPSAVQAVVAGHPVYDFKLLLDGKQINEWKGKPITISIRYELKSTEKPHQVVFYYVDETGQLQAFGNSKYDKDNATASFKPKHFSPYAIGYPAVAFRDVPASHWANLSVETLAARGIVKGVASGVFDPNRAITRAEFVQLLVSTFDLMDETASANFKDVPRNAWYYGAVASAVKSGIASGLSSQRFAPNEPITREQMAVMAYRAALAAGVIDSSLQANSISFKDASAISSYAKQAVGMMQTAGVIDGMGSNTYAPKASTTRAQAASVIFKLYGMLDQ